jgi:DNA-binding beta-propeller fold protein YncE
VGPAGLVDRRTARTLVGARVIPRLAVLAALVVLGVSAAGPVTAQRAGEGPVPRFTVDPFWPKPLPNRWLLGQVSGVAVDDRDHVWIVQRPKSLTEDERGAALTPPRSLCCVPAPPVMEFDPAGNLVQAWGGPGAGYDWPANEHGIFVDHTGHVWLAGNGEKDHHVLKFTRAGRFVLQIGKPGASRGDGDTQNLNRPADTRVDPATNELYVADGYGNHRVIVFDAGTGAYKRHWGANGRPPGEAGIKPFANPVHCVRVARDGLVYVCDRRHYRIQVFRKDGAFVGEFPLAPDTRGNGSVWDLDFSRDAAQAYLYAADGENNHIWLLSRETGKVLSQFGRSGRYAGQLHWVHNLAVDSKGNIYTAEVDSAKRAQKFVYQGLTSPSQ